MSRKQQFPPKSAGNAIRSKWGSSARAVTLWGGRRMRTHGEYLGIPEQIRSAFCERCHLVEKKCNSCHASHAFSSKTASEPEACGNCHLGPDHPHKEMYETSLHGMIYKMTQNPKRAPRCVTCHMPGDHITPVSALPEGPEGTNRGSWTSKEIPSLGEEEEKRREEMIQTCTGCHSRRFAVRTTGKCRPGQRRSL